MLVGRESEQQRIAALLAGARVSQSGVLVISGEAGIGKTALLEDAVRQADQMQILRTSGSEHESSLGFASLHQLLLPMLARIEHIPAPQREALAIALTLRRGAPPERFAVAAATLSLLSRSAEEGPLLVAVDDAHLLDTPSAETLRFVARRLIADPIAMVMSLRPERGAVLADAGLPAMQLSGLDLASARTLLAEARGGAPSVELTAKLHEATAGNPLGLLELSRDQERWAAMPAELPLPVPEAVVHAFAQRITSLPEPAWHALLLAAIADGDLATTARAAPALQTRVDELSGAEKLGLLQLIPGRAVFRHPLVRSAIYTAALPDERRNAHRAVAEALPPTARDRRAWHLSEACVGPDDGVADALGQVADHARARGAHSAAAAALIRGAGLTADQARRGARLLRAGESAWLAGQVGQADALLQQAAALVTDTASLADIDGLRGNLALRTGSLRQACTLLSKAAARVQATDPDRAALRLADVVTASFYLCDSDTGLAAAEQLERLIGDCTSAAARARSQVAVGMARVIGGGAGMEWIRAGVQSLSEEPGLRDDPHRPDWAVIGTLFLRESRVGRDLMQHVVQQQRTRTALGALPNLLFHIARDDATTDRWSSARAGFDESIALASETGQTTDLAVSLAGLAWLYARMGRADECRANADEALLLAGQNHIALAKLWAMFALGDLNLALGEADAALDAFADLEKTLRDIGFLDVDVAPAPELTEIQLRRGDIQTAAHIAHDYLCRAEQKGQPWALARGHRAVALTCTEPAEQSALFEKALRWHAQSLDLFEEARTRLAFGAALRRNRSRVAARPHLREALSAFERLGANPWADTAAGELDATGEHIQRGPTGYLTALTAQELRIAQMLGDGKTTRDTAAALFLSPKTVEYHLRHVYQKLGIGSRTELADAMAVESQGRSSKNRNA